VLGVKGAGAITMACDSDPTPVEANYCIQSEMRCIRNWVKPVLWLIAMYSVACLEWLWERR